MLLINFETAFCFLKIFLYFYTHNLVTFTGSKIRFSLEKRFIFHFIINN